MINNVTLTGRLIKDLELKYSPSGVAVVKFTIAVNRRFKKEGQPEADFITCTAFQKTAETMANHLSKGALIGVEGSIQTGSYEKNGQKVYTTDVMVEKFTFLESKQQNQQNNAAQQQNLQQQAAIAGGYQQGQYQQQPPQQQYQQQPQYQQQNTNQQPPQQQQYGQGNPFGNNGPVQVDTDQLPF